MKNIKVVAAVIKKDNKIFITQRGYGEFKDGWEFPGGKVEINENEEHAIIREIKEELDADIEVEKFITNVEYDYSTFHLSMNIYLCKLKEEHLVLLEHENSAWVSKEELDSFNFLPADRVVLNKIKEFF